MTRVIVAPDEDAAAEVAADHLAAVIRSRPRPVLGFATGGTPAATYVALAKRVRAEGLNVSRMRGFALEEYVGLPLGHEQSCRAVLDREVTGLLGLPAGAIIVPDGDPGRAERAAAEYDDAIRGAGGIHTQLLDVGENGHLAFNEPGSSLRSRTRVFRLGAATRADNARFFPSRDDAPTRSVTHGRHNHGGRASSSAGLRRVKAAAIAAAVESPVSSSCPASVIQLHPRATVVADPAAARLLRDRQRLDTPAIRTNGRANGL